ncbi:uncharacterized protein F5891DRAFT_1194321 [Suillus fuscotomentosus]|uniref:DUF6532 domain-containing protein n=1 Tax=Suillus fuscotomentosus TaxID=1912939 RepID=A0AAD4DYL1_9AGAM|nr:uncharacterized protein F5891DRAFT_1194321 [Suillus fuscotomentosus]KAG1895264.1 hypothetical protein F5891DRAFT_1194321 [Suillus fuscotomentosus]
MSTDWSIAFKPILDLHSKAIFAAGSSSVGKPAIKEYYAKDKEEADEREAASHPREPSFYKKPLSEWDVAQKLFKQEINTYDKAQQQSKGLEYSIKYRTGNAREWFNNMTPSQQQEVKFAMKKWNEEGVPEETQAIYHKNNLKKTLEDFAEQIWRTMGCCIVMLVSHKKKASQTLSVSLHETTPQNAKKHFSVSSSGIQEWAANGFESFGEWSKTEFYPSEDSDHAASDCEDGPVLPEIIVDDEGYAKLPLHDGIGLKGQHELIRSIFHTSYKVCTGSSRPVPWGVITASPSNYLKSGSVLTGYVVKDPSHMKTEEVNHLWMYWEQRSATNQKLVIFIKAKDADIQITGKSKMKVVSTLDLDEEDQGWLAPFTSHFTERTTQLATHAIIPDDVAINDRYTFLETLSKNENYLELMDATRDLAILAKQNVNVTWCCFQFYGLYVQQPISEQHQDLPTWADWSWSENYLPEDIHTSYATLTASLNKLQTCPISGPSSAMPVVLGIGLLYRESKHVIEYEEDEANPNTPFYLPHSAIDLQFLVALDEAVQEVLCSVVSQIERLNKEALSDNDEKMRMVVEKERHEVGEKNVESEENVVRGEEQQEQEVEEVVQKGRKRKINHALSTAAKYDILPTDVYDNNEYKEYVCSQVQDLLDGGNFLHNGVDEQGRTNNLMNDALGEFCSTFFYMSEHALAKSFPDEFAEAVPKGDVALGATTLTAAIDEYKTSIYKPMKFVSELYQPIYNSVMQLYDDVKLDPYHSKKCQAVREKWVHAAGTLTRNQSNRHHNWGLKLKLD